jgi:hypothetical protein
MFNNRGMQDLNFVELARRGFVVLAIDMFSHGDSATVPNIGIIVGSSINEGVVKLSRLNYVDPERIGVTGHSLGGMSSNTAVAIDNGRPTPLISAVLLNSANATWGPEPGVLGNIYGNRHVGIVAPQFEEFFMLDVDAHGNMTSPVHFMSMNNAQSFLHFGQHPAGLPQRESGVMYREVIDGREAIRVIYSLPIIHPWSHFSAMSTAGTVEFFDAALGAPNPIAPSSQIWQWKAFFNVLGLVAIFVFLVNFVSLMLFTKPFEKLRSEELAEPLETNKNGKIWFFVMMGAAALFAALTYLPILRETNAFPSTNERFSQTQSFGVAAWALANGLFGLLMMVIYYFGYGKKAGFSPAKRGIKISLPNIGRTFALAALSLTAFFGILFFADYFFMVDFRIWTMALRPFQSARLLFALFPYMLFMTVFFIVNSLSATSFNYNDTGRKKWVNMLIFSAINVLPAVIIIGLQYVTFFTTGWLLFGDHAAGAQGPYQMFTIWMFPFVAILTLTPIIARKIYRLTNNPYLAGILNGVIVTMMTAANTLTWQV